MVYELTVKDEEQEIRKGGGRSGAKEHLYSAEPIYPSDGLAFWFPVAVHLSGRQTAA